MKTRLPLLVLAASVVTAAWAAPSLPEGYTIYHSISADFDGDGQKETAYAIQANILAELPPRLWVTKGEARQLDLWLKYTNALSTGNAVPHEALQAADLTGDGRPELLFIPSSAGGSGGTQHPRVARWSGGGWVNMELTGRKLTHISENGGAVLKRQGRTAVLYLYDISFPSARYEAQPFTYRNGKLVGGALRRSRARREAGLRELGLKQ